MVNFVLFEKSGKFIPKYLSDLSSKAMAWSRHGTGRSERITEGSNLFCDEKKRSSHRKRRKRTRPKGGETIRRMC